MIEGLFNPFLNARTACERVLRMAPQPLVRLPQAVHVAAFAPTGVGKSRGLVMPFLETCDESTVIMDFKGELFQDTAAVRRRMGHHIVVLDPYCRVTKEPDGYNAVDQIDAESPLALDDCNDLADALVSRNPASHEPHWDESAIAYIAANLAVTAAYGDKALNTRSLQQVRDILCHPGQLDLATKLMAESKHWNGLLAQMGSQLLHFVDREKSSVLSSALRHLRFLGTVPVLENTRRSTFDPRELRNGKMTIYLVMPPEHRHAQAGLLRMWVSSLLRVCVRDGIESGRNVHFVLDETAALGHLKCLEDALSMGRGYGIRLQFYFQSLAQVKQCFPEGQDQTLLGNCTQIFFGTNDLQTAEMVSKRLGEHTILVDSGGTSTGRSWGHTSGAHPSSNSGGNWGSNRNWNQQARALLRPEEVMALPHQVAITFVPGVPPVLTRLIRNYEKDFRRSLGGGGGLRAALWVLLRAASACVLMILCAMLFAAAVAAKSSRHQSNRHFQPGAIHVKSK